MMKAPAEAEALESLSEVGRTGIEPVTLGLKVPHRTSNVRRKHALLSLPGALNALELSPELADNHLRTPCFSHRTLEGCRKDAWPSMPRFEQRVTDEQVAAARKKIAAGASLRSAAAEVPCAASTLSDRIKKAVAREADALRRGGIERPGVRSRGRATRGLPAAEVTDDAFGPLEVLQGALLANRVTGEPDWPTRVTAARALAALQPELIQSAAERDPAPAIVVYDLEPGTLSVLHRPPRGTATPDDDAATPTPPLEPGIYLLTEGDESTLIAEVNVAAGEPVTVHLIETRARASEIMRAVGGNVDALETKLAGKESSRRGNAHKQDKGLPASSADK
jgi:hypothetical protein